MIIKEDLQLDYNDVLIAPQTTTANHRGDVNPIREFRHLGLSGVPVMTANMTQMGNFETAKVMLDEGCFATLHKFYTSNEIIEWVNKEFDGKLPQNLFITVGLRNKDKEIIRLHNISAYYNLQQEESKGLNILIDVPNAYIPAVKEYVEQIRREFPKATLAVGNVSSGDEVQRLIRSGADIVKVGIGPSCFTGQMPVITKNGKKKIKDIQVGEEILTHTGTYKKVINKFTFVDNTKVIKINNIECTPNHKFLVCNKEDKDKVTEINYMDYCYWCEAEKLDAEKQYILKIKL